ncbi:DUF2142 domain-containing protein [Pseudactinotalea sp. Z1732]|uniref:DUF2142 domain-containing protein n=1 Tax=Micrococcales TaxID=85006 RepID=UPI003C79E734
MHPDVAPGQAPRRARSRMPRAVVVLTAVWVASLLLWSVLLPTFRSADESWHVSAAYYQLETGDWPGFQQMPELWWVIEATPPGHGDYEPLPAQGPPGADASFTERRDETVATSEPATNRAGQHPPLYYALLGMVIEVAPSQVPAAQTVWTLRLVSVALLGPLPLLLAHGARRLGGNRPVTIIAAALPLTVPQLGALGGAVNNDNLLIAAAAATTVLVTHTLSGDLRYRIAALTGLALAVALLSKAFALVLVPFVVLAYLVAGRRFGRFGAALRGLALAGAVAALGGWWWVVNLLRYGTVQPAGHSRPRPDGPLGIAEALPGYAAEAATLIPMRFWATLSIKRGDLPPPFPYALTITLFVVLVAALVAIPLLARRFPGLRALDAVVLVVPFFASLALVLAGTFGLYRETGLAAGLQGRYLYVGLAGAFVVLALAAGWLPRRYQRFVPILVTLGALVFLAVSMRKVLGFHWATRDSTMADGVAALRAWSPVPDVVLALIALVGVVAALWALIEVWPGRLREASGAPEATSAVEHHTTDGDQ